MSELEILTREVHHAGRGPDEMVKTSKEAARDNMSADAMKVGSACRCWWEEVALRGYVIATLVILGVVWSWVSDAREARMWAQTRTKSLPRNMHHGCMLTICGLVLVPVSILALLACMV